MMRLLLLTLLLATAAQAQEADTLTAADGWRNDVVASLAGNQARFSNWSEGGVDALAATASLDGSFDRVVGRVLTEQTLRLAYGILRQDTLDVRKALDVALYQIEAEVASAELVRPAASFTARTQFAPGYDYAPTAARYPSQTVVPGEPLQVSAAFAPLVLNQSLGVALRPGDGMVGRAGLGLKETIITIERLRPIYGNDPDEAVRVQAGLDVELGFERKVMENVTFKSRLATFTSFGHVGDEAPDIRFGNVLLLKVNSLLNVRFDADVVYDADVSEDAQIREVLSVGLSIPLL